MDFLKGDVRSFNFPTGDFPFVIHAATDVTSAINNENPLLNFQTIVLGTQHVLEFALTHGASNFLLLSSGAVYGTQPPTMTHVPEDYAGAPDSADPASAYGEGKRAAESLCALYSYQYGLAAKIARFFAVAGPHMPLYSRYAIGNFIRDAIRGGPIKINGDGTPYRSYLYASDLMIWLWTILLKGKPARPYNVGSNTAITIADLAKKVRDAVNPRIEIAIAGKPVPGSPPHRYVPSTDRSRDELQLEVMVPLDQTISKSVRWYNGLNEIAARR
jgi:dTDP-glucose 4,6-dehydratase